MADLRAATTMVSATELNLSMTYSGRFEAVETVELRPRVSGAFLSNILSKVASSERASHRTPIFAGVVSALIFIAGLVGSRVK